MIKVCVATLLVLLTFCGAPVCGLFAGYYAGAMEGLGKGDYIDETRPWCNIVHVAYNDPAAAKGLILKAASKGMSTLLTVQGLFFPHQSCVIYPDYQQRFQNYWNVLAEAQGHVFGFYVFDEPFPINSSHPGCQEHRQFSNYLAAQISCLNALAPGRKTMVLFSRGLNLPNIHELIPQSLDYFGFDIYGSPNEDILKWMNRALSVKYPRQRLIMNVEVYASSPPNDATDQYFVKRISYYKAVIQQHRGEVAGLLSFLYTTYPPKSLYGAMSMPKSRDFLGAYMREYRDALESPS